MPGGTRAIALSPYLPVTRIRAAVTEGPDKGRSVEEAGGITIGTAADNLLRLSDDTVSRYHLELTTRGQGILVADLGSTNGTFASGSLSIERAVIEPGTVLRIGHSAVEVSCGDRAVIELHREEALGELRGRTEAARRLMASLRRLASKEVCVLLIGETGTGKELAAHALHAESPRRDRPFITVDCGSLAPSLVASELFGHERGAFTGADRQRIGAFERAHGGTVFLDEVGELPAELQTHLLGVLERMRFTRVGGSDEIAVDVRVISATNRDLRAAVNSGVFRADLYYRLAVVTVNVPPLRERAADIPMLIEHFLRECGYDDPAERLFPESALQRLASHHWPGNVRELRNVVEATLATGERPSLRPLRPEHDTPLVPLDMELPYKEARNKLLGEFETLYVKALLDRTGGNVSQAARIACMTRSHLFDLLRKHGLR